MRTLLMLIGCVALFSRLHSQSCNLICNGSFDDYYLTNSVGLFTTIACWSTTATDGNMEVWGTGFNGVQSHSGSQHIELNATQGATMYQDFPVTANTTYTVCFAHRGRAGIDSMAVSVGPAPSGPYVTLGQYGDGTSAWGYYCVIFTPTITGTYRVRFTPIYWAGGNQAIGNFLDAVSVSGPANFSVAVSATAICQGNTSTLSVTGATSHSWSTSSTASAIVVSPTITTSYTLRATAGSCTAVSIHTVFVIAAAVTVSGSTICAGSAGTLTATGAQNYTWSPGNSTGSVLVVSPPGTTVYSVIAMSAQGCTASNSATLSVTPLPSVSFTTDGGSCTSLGQATAQASGGIGPYSYNWMPGSQTGSVAVNLNANSYTVNVFDNGTGCATSSVMVLSPFQTSLTASGSTVCTGQPLYFYASASTGVTYTWTGPNGFYSNLQNPQISNPTFSASGAYTVNISSTNGCTNAAVVYGSVTNPPVLTATLSDTTFCARDFNGSVNNATLYPGGANSYTVVTPPLVQCVAVNAGTNTVFVLQALPPFQPVISVVTATLYGSSLGLCTASITLSFSVIPNPIVTVSSSTTMICAGESFTYQSTGAQNYTWTNISPNTTFFSNNTIGVSVPDQSAGFAVYGSSLGCNSAQASGSITVIPFPTLAIVPNTVSVCAGNSVSLSVHGAALNYSWNPSTGLDATSGQLVNAMPQNNTSYTVTGAVFHCSGSAVATVSVLPLPAPTASFVKSRICLHENAALEGNGGLVYEWFAPNGMTYKKQNVSFPVNSPGHAGTYTLRVTDKNNCKGSATTTLVIEPVPDGYLTGSMTGACVPFCSEFKFTGRGAAVTGTWTLNSKKYGSSTFTQCISSPGTHTLRGILEDTITGCRSGQDFTVIGYPQPAADFRWEPEQLPEVFEEVVFSNSSTGENQVEWNWFFANDNNYKPVGEGANYMYPEPGRYTVAMVVKNGWGCADTVVKYIEIADLHIYVPDVFTPNGDGRNEVFVPVASGLLSYSMAIYDRWGEQIFQTNDIKNGWDGTYKGNACKTDVYNWLIQLTTGHGERRQMQGRVSLLR